MPKQPRRRWLPTCSPNRSPVSASRHLVLVGLMGTGKSTVGAILADWLHRPLLDSDAMVEARTGRTVREIWLADGEAAYRLLEEEALRAALSESPSVIAAAGGVVLSGANRAALVESGADVVWLRAEPDELVERVRSQGHRPLLDDDPHGTLTRMASDREALYRHVATTDVITTGRTASQVADEVLAFVVAGGAE
jgi:shikimate kinase